MKTAHKNFCVDMKDINWGIIGCGDVTEIKSGPAFNRIKGSRLHAVMRRDANKAKDYAQRHQVPKWYDDGRDLINDPHVNAIYIATPPSSHESYAIEALKTGKPVYLEKPMSTDSISAKRISDAAKAYDTKLSVAHYRRQLPLFKKIKELLDNHYIGDIRFINLQLLQPNRADASERATYNWRLEPSISGGGYFHDLAPHQLDLLYYFFDEPVYISGISLNQAGFYSADDTVAGTMAFKNGILMNGLWSFTVPDFEAKDICEIVGLQGSMRFSIFKMQDLTVIKNGHVEQHYFDPVPHVQQPMIEKVVEYFSDRGPNPCSAEEGVTVMQMIDAFTRR